MQNIGLLNFIVPDFFSVFSAEKEVNCFLFKGHNVQFSFYGQCESGMSGSLFPITMKNSQFLLFSFPIISSNVRTAIKT